MNIKNKDSDIIGKKFGKLTPFEKVNIRDKNNTNRIYYNCSCECGNDKLISKSSIIDGSGAKSCGCDRKTKNKSISKNPLQDLVGMSFHRLTVVKQVEKPENRKNKERFWLCKCDCGSDKEVIVPTKMLNNGNTRSCGCIKSERTIKFNKETKKKYNKYDLFGEYGVGYTEKGEEFYFDLDDYDKIKDYCWRIGNRGYVMCTIHYLEKKYNLLFHRLVTECPDNKVVDHINGKETRHDNREYNLRVCEHQENMCNYPIPINNTSGAKGVYWDKGCGMWRACITSKGDRINLGIFDVFEDVVESRVQAEKLYHGEYMWEENKKTYY